MSEPRDAAAADAGAEPSVLYETRGPVALVTLNRPHFRNAQSWELLDRLDEQLDRAVADETVRVVVLRGAGRHFSSGHDLGTPQQQADVEERGLVQWEGLDWYEAFRRYNLDLTVKWRNLTKPTIAMVHGYCIFGGWMIATAMDLIFAAPSARFLCRLCSRPSPCPGTSIPGRPRSCSSRAVSSAADEARDLGFVNRVIAEDDLERETLAYAERVAENHPAVLRMAKLAVNKAQDTQGYSAFVEGAFADYLVLRDVRGDSRVEGKHRLGGVELALRGERGDRPGQRADDEGSS